ncbi:MAG: LD-carboxypeptidase [Thermodesulfobacteriota bacterium]
MNPRNNKLLIPARLKPGDKIGVVAPASPFDRKAFRQGIMALEQMGFAVHVPMGVFEKKRYLAGTDDERAGRINSLFRDKTVRGIICARGGYGSLRLLSLLDYKTIRKNPKVFVGFSDVTALLTAFYTRCGLVGFHGPMVTTLATATRAARKALYGAVASAGKLQLTSRRGVIIRAGRASGTVVGGNLTTVSHLLGTPFAPVLKKHVLILEEINEAPYRLDRMLTQMKLAGCFNGLAGLVLGTFKNCGNRKDVYEIAADIFRDGDFPILAGFSFGHVRGNPTVPIGVKATLDTDANLLSFHDAPTAAE